MTGLMMKYFVLKPRGNDAHAKASRAAMRTYANHMLAENRTFALELRAWVDRETRATEAPKDGE
jgi:hypothetical protein